MNKLKGSVYLLSQRVSSLKDDRRQEEEVEELLVSELNGCKSRPSGSERS